MIAALISAFAFLNIVPAPFVGFKGCNLYVSIIIFIVVVDKAEKLRYNIVERKHKEVQTLYKLTIGNQSCVVRDNDGGAYDFITFDAVTAIFDLDSKKSELAAFFKTQKQDDKTLNEAINAVKVISEAKDYTLQDIESILGNYNVPFPVIDEDGALLSYCENAVCVVLSVLRYLAMNKYKFSVCIHCGKPFCFLKSRRNSNRKFCLRNSPCVLSDRLSYTHLSCEQATRNAKQQLSRMKKRCYDADYNSVSGSLGASYLNFLNKCCEYTDRQPTADNLKEYYDFLKSEMQERGIAK